MSSRKGAAGPLVTAAACFVAPTLVLGWFFGWQAAFGRIDAALAIPLMMPGAFLFARLTRAFDQRRFAWTVAAAALLLFAAQVALHISLAERWGIGSALTALLFAILSCSSARLIDRLVRAWWVGLRWIVVMLGIALWFGIGQLALAEVFRAPRAAHRPPVVMLTSLPLRWSGGGDIAQMLAEGPADLPALAAIEHAVDLRLVDTLTDIPQGATLLLAHPRALAPAELVRIDAYVRSGGAAVILADALSTWPPPHPLGDSRNPPITSLLTPLLDHWGVDLVAPQPGADESEDVRVFAGPDGAMLRLQSAGRFTRLPAGCRSYGDGRVVQCAIGKGRVWLVSDADLLHADLWQSPVGWAPWLQRSDTVDWLIGRLGGQAEYRRPLWIRAHRD